MRRLQMLRPFLAPQAIGDRVKQMRSVRRTAFFLVRDFFRSQHRNGDGAGGERPIPRRDFSRFLPEDYRAAVKEFLLLGGWLFVAGDPQRGVAARRYKLAPELWPAIPGEPVLFVPDP